MYVDDTGMEALIVCIVLGYNMAEKGFARVLDRGFTLTERDKEDIYNLWKGGMKQRDIANIYGVDHTTICRYIGEYAVKTGEKVETYKNKKRLTQEQKEIVQEQYRKYRSLASAAKRLEVSYSWLHKELKNEGITYKDLLEGIV